MLDCKDTRVNHTARQKRLHKNDRSKTSYPKGTILEKPWKYSKGYGTSSGKVATPGRNYGRHVDNISYINKSCKANVHPLDDEDIHLDYNDDWREDDYDFERREERRMVVDLMSIARPARTRRNMKRPVSRKIALDTLDVADAQSDTTHTDFDFDFAWECDFTGSCVSDEGSEYDGEGHNGSGICTPLHDTPAPERSTLIESLPSSLEPLLVEYDGLGDLAAYSYWLEPLLQDFSFEHDDNLPQSGDLEGSSVFEGIDWENIAFCGFESEDEGCSDCDWVDLCEEGDSESGATSTVAAIVRLETT